MQELTPVSSGPVRRGSRTRRVDGFYADNRYMPPFYVGITSHLEDRLRAHRRRFGDRIIEVRICWFDSREAALLAEGERIAQLGLENLENVHPGRYDGWLCQP